MPRAINDCARCHNASSAESLDRSTREPLGIDSGEPTMKPATDCH